MNLRTAAAAALSAALMGTAALAGPAPVAAHEETVTGLMPYPFWTAPQPDDIYHIPTGTMLSFEGMMDMVSSSRIIYIGEAHTNIHAHRVQLEVIRELERRQPGKVAIGMEMFRHPQQPSLDRWTAGAFTELEFLKESKWFDNWQSDFGYYRDILVFAKERGIDVVALNPPKDLQRMVGMTPKDKLPADVAANMPDTDGSDPYQREVMAAVFGGHEGGQNMLDAFFRVQLFWEETMAETIAGYLSDERGKGKKMVVLAGGAHVEYGFGVPKKVLRRLPAAYSIVMPAALSIPEEKKEEVLMDVQVPEVPLLTADFLWMVPYEDLEDEGVRMGIMMKNDEGAVVVEKVLEGSPAETAGFFAGDRIVNLDGLAVEGMGDVLVVVKSKRRGDGLTALVERGGEPLSLEVSFPKDMELPEHP